VIRFRIQRATVAALSLRGYVFETEMFKDHAGGGLVVRRVSCDRQHWSPAGVLEWGLGHRSDVPVALLVAWPMAGSVNLCFGPEPTGTRVWPMRTMLLAASAVQAAA
jgi:hypothetical protein